MTTVALVTAGKLHMAANDVYVHQKTLKCGVDINAGQQIRPDKTTGRWVLADATTAANGADVFTAHSSKKAGQALTGIRGCEVDGFDLDDLDYGDPVYLSDTPGAVDDTAGTVSIIVGYTRPATAQPRGVAPDKLLYLVHG